MNRFVQSLFKRSRSSPLPIRRFTTPSGSRGPNGPIGGNTTTSQSTFKFPVGKSIAVSGATVLGLWYYFHLEKEKMMNKKEAASGSVGAPKIGGPFSLTDHNGTPFSFPKDLNGAHALVYFGFTNCPDICPEELDKISTAIDLVSKNSPACKLQTLFITCDPERDDPKAIKEYLKDFHPSIIGITGPLDLVKEAARLFRVYFKAAKTGTNDSDYLVDHTIFYYLMDPEGRYVTHFGREHHPEDVAQSIVELIQQYNKSRPAVQ